MPVEHVADVAQVLTLEALRSVPLFASLDDDATRALRDLLEVRNTPAGTVLCRVGEPGTAMYLIEDGRVRIHVHDADGHEVTLAELGNGDFFGEMAILDGKVRSADATVIEDACIVVLSRDHFLEFMLSNPNIALKLLSAIADRLRRTDALLRQRVSRNINEEEQAQLTRGDRMADVLAEFGGSWKFISVTGVLLILWIAFNSWVLNNAGPDPFPYSLLGLVLGVIAGMQAPIIMMSQNRQAHKDRLRADMDYQVNLKNELAIAEMLRRLDVLESERLPVLFDEQNSRITSSINGQAKDKVYKQGSEAPTNGR